MNLVEITIRVNGASAAVAEMEKVSSGSEKEADKTKTSWSKVGSTISDIGGALGKVFLAGNIVAMGGALGGLALTFGAFGAVAIPTLKGIDTYLTSTGKAAQTAWDNLDPTQRSIVRDIQGVESQFKSLAKSFEPVVEGVAKTALGIATKLLPAISDMAHGGANLLNGILKPLSNLFGSDFFHNFAKQMENLATNTAPSLGKAITGLVKQLLTLIENVGPDGATAFVGLIKACSDAINAIAPVIGILAKAGAAMTKTKGGAALLAGGLVALGFAWLAGFGPVGWVIGILAGLGVALMVLWKKSETFRDVSSQVASDVVAFYISMAQGIVGALHFLGDAFLNFVKTVLIMGASIPGPWQATARSLLASFDSMKRGMDDWFNNASGTLDKWKTGVQNLPKMVKLQGDITDLRAKISEGLALLRNPNLTATRRANIEADISQARAQIAAIEAELAALNGRTATTYVKTIPIGGGTGGIRGGPDQNIVMPGSGGWKGIGNQGSGVPMNPGAVSPSGSSGGGNSNSGQTAEQIVRVILEWAPNMNRDKLIEFLMEAVREKGGDPRIFTKKVEFAP